MVWEGRQPGIYDDWAEALLQVENFKGAKYKSFTSLTAATEAFRKGDGKAEADLARLFLFENDPKMPGGMRSEARKTAPGWKSDPTVDRNAIAVDAACSGNPGAMEYRGVELATGREIFHIGPLPGGTNNIGEYLAIVHALALCAQKGMPQRRIYTDSVTGLSWIRRRHSNTKIQPTAENATVLNLLLRADRWVAAHSWLNPITKWDTDKWGEIPADFGRK